MNSFKCGACEREELPRDEIAMHWPDDDTYACLRCVEQIAGAMERIGLPKQGET